MSRDSAAGQRSRHAGRPAGGDPSYLVDVQLGRARGPTAWQASEAVLVCGSTRRRVSRSDCSRRQTSTDLHPCRGRQWHGCPMYVCVWPGLAHHQHPDSRGRCGCCHPPFQGPAIHDRPSLPRPASGVVPRGGGCPYRMAMQRQPHLHHPCSTYLLPYSRFFFPSSPRPVPVPRPRTFAGSEVGASSRSPPQSMHAESRSACGARAV